VKRKYAIVIEKAPNNYAAYAPDVLGCVSTSKTRDGIIEMMREALELHIEDMVEQGCPVPDSRSSIRDAMEYHIALYDEVSEPDDYEETETSFIMVEVEVESARTFAAAEMVGGGAGLGGQSSALPCPQTV